MLGPLLFVIFINNLDLNVGGLVSMFADDTKISGATDCEEGNQSIDQLYRSAAEMGGEVWMEFNLSKCEVLHVGRSMARGKYISLMS